MNLSKLRLWSQLCALGAILIASSILDFSCGGGGQGGNAGVAPPPVAVAAGGIPSGDQSVHYATNTAEIYDPTTGNFSYTGSMSQARAAPGVALLQDGSVLFAGGLATDAQTCAASNTPECPTATAEIFANQLFTALPTMKTPRAFHAVNLLRDGTVLITGGATANTDPNTGDTVYKAINPPNPTAEIYNPFVKRFLSTGDLNTPRMSFGSALLPNGSVLIAGGTSSFDAGNGALGIPASAPTALASFETYNPKTRTFTSSPGMVMHFARISPVVAALNNGMILVAGGDADSSCNPNCPPTAEFYDPASNTFVTNQPINIYKLTQSLTNWAYAFESNGNLLFAGGMIVETVVDPLTGIDTPVDTPVNLLAEYAPGGSFQISQDFNFPRFYHQMTLMDNDAILITGGLTSTHARFSNGNCLLDPSFDPDAYLADAELFTNGTFSVTGGLNSARAMHSAIKLTNGTVLVAGGYFCGAVSPDAQCVQIKSSYADQSCP